jgi:predicted peptidase
MLSAKVCTGQTFDPFNRTITLNGHNYPFRIFLPRDLSHVHQIGVLLYLHGAGERGTDGLLPTTAGLGPAIQKNVSEFPFVVVFPQCPVDSAWQGEPAEAALTALDTVLSRYHIDGRRVYLVGVSMGGFGTWEFALKHPGKFAAIVSVCGGIVPPPDDPRLRAPTVRLEGPDPYLAVARRLRGIPAWLFHGALDRIVPVAESRNLVKAFRDIGTPVRYTEYDDVGHTSWNRAFSTTELWEWLGEQHNVQRWRE